MSEYLKMADVFKGDVIYVHMSDEAVQELAHGDDAGTNYHLEDDAYWLASSEEHMKYAAHAINTHDSLVAEVERLRKEVKNQKEMMDDMELYIKEISERME